MTPSIIELAPTREDRRIARLAALAIALSLMEAVIPSPLPGVKPGIANIVTLVVLVRFGSRASRAFTALRATASAPPCGCPCCGWWRAA